MKNWKSHSDYPPENSQPEIFGWEFARRNADIKAGRSYFVNAPDLDPSQSYWRKDPGGVVIDGRLLIFSNALFPAHALSGASLGTAQSSHMHVDIDLTEPLSETIRRIEVLAKLHRKRLPADVIRHEHSKLSPSKLIQYLRILDALEAGASYREIEAELHIGHTAVEEGRARGIELRDGRWREIMRIKPKVLPGES